MEDQVIDILHAAREITCATLWAPPRLLIQRLGTRQLVLIKPSLKRSSLRQIWPRMVRMRQAQQLYRRPSRLAQQYDAWFQFCATYHALAHWIMDTTEHTPRLIHLAEWPDLRQKLAR